MDWQHLPSLNALRAFLAFHEAGSMSAAGALLNVSHAAISQQIKALETHLGLTLLDRRPRRTFLTAEGSELARTLQHAFGDISKTVQVLTGAEEGRPLQISTTPSFASGWLIPRLADFRARNPSVKLMIDPSVDVKELAPGGLDVALRYGDGNWPGLEADLIALAPQVVVASPTLVGEDKELTIDELRALPWLVEPGANESSQWRKSLGLNGDFATGGTSELPGNLILDGVRTGQGVAVVALNLVENDIESGRLKVLLQDPEPNGYYAVTRQSVQRPALRAFTSWLRQQSTRSETAVAAE